MVLLRPRLILHSCASKYKSNKAVQGELALYDVLAKMSVFETGSLITNLVLRQANAEVVVSSGRVSIHQEIHKGVLKLFVPKDQEERIRCLQKVPTTLCHILEIVDPEAALTVSVLLRCKTQELDALMQDCDISPVPWIRKPVIAHSSVLEQLSIWETSHIAVNKSQLSIPSVTTGCDAEDDAQTSSGTTSCNTIGTPRSSDAQEAGFDVPTLRAHSGNDSIKQAYTGLLEQIIKVVNHSESLSNTEAWDMSSLWRALSDETANEERVFDKVSVDLRNRG